MPGHFNSNFFPYTFLNRFCRKNKYSNLCKPNPFCIWNSIPTIRKAGKYFTACIMTSECRALFHPEKNLNKTLTLVRKSWQRKIKYHQEEWNFKLIKIDKRVKVSNSSNRKMKKFNASVIILLIAFSASAQQKTAYTPHVVFDDVNKVYAVRMSSTTFLKFIDSTGRFLTKGVTNGKDYIGKGHTARVVPPGQETTYATKPEAQALLDYWNQLQIIREQQKVKAPHYSE
jgi:hypothetical protein